MNKLPFFKQTRVKIVLLTLSFILIALLGLIPLVIVLFMAQTLFIRILIAASGIIWAILTISFISFKADYSMLWRQWRHERRHSHMKQVFERYPEYMALRQKYPMSIRRYEQHNRHRKHPLSEKEMVRQALEVSEEEWAAREEFRQEYKKEKHSSESAPQHL